MRKLVLTILFSLLSFGAWADSCQVDGSRDFTIDFDFYDVSDPDLWGYSFWHYGELDSFFQVLYYTTGSRAGYIWNTEGHKFYLSSLFTEQRHYVGEGLYNAKIEYSANNNRVRYYKKSVTSQNWGSAIATRYYSFPEQSISIISDAFPHSVSPYSDGISNLSCNQDQASNDVVASITSDICSYFPQPAQSWDTSTSTSLTISSSKNGGEDYDYHIGGWSQSYIDANLTQVDHPWNGTKINKLTIGYDSAVGWGNDNPSYQSCDVGGCAAGGSKAETPPEIAPHFPNRGDLTLSFNNFGTGYSNDLLVLCPIDDSGAYCRYEGNDVVTIKGDLRSLTVQGGWNRTLKVRFETDTGDYGRIIGSYTTNNYVISQFLEAGTYTFNTVNFNTNTELETASDIVWVVNSSLTFSNEVNYTSTGNPDDFFILAPNDGSRLTFNNIVNPFYGLIMADTVNFTNDIALHGAVTANNLTMATNNSAIIGESECFTSEPTEDLYLEITEEKEFALLCENPEFTFTVRDAENNNEIDTDYSGTIEITLPSGISVDSVVKGSGSDGSYTPENGELILSLSASTYGTYTIEGELSADSTKTDSSELYVAPYKIDSDTVSAIAGNDTGFSVTVLACNDGSATRVSGYDGSKSLTRSNATLEQPTSAQGGVTGNLTVAGTTSTSLSLDFNNGAATSSLNYDESGAFSFILSDATFTCPTGFDCETEDGENWDSLKGVVNVNARPWTFAICEPNSHTMNGTSSSGDGFVAAGESFTLNVMPIRYLGGSITGDILVGDSYCNSSYVTKNFFNSYAPSATINLVGSLSSPSGGLPGGSTLVSTGYSKINTEHNSEQYEYTGLSWDEVGSLEIGADTVANYFAMDINRGYREIGRFYPNHLSVEDHSWTYASGHDGFAYMSQPIGHSFTIEAMNAEGNPVANYRLFTDSLIADMQFYAVQGNTDLIGRIDGTDQNSDSILATWGGRSNWELVTKNDGSEVAQMNIRSLDFTFVKNPDTSETNYTTIPDGPFDSTNSEFGIEITDRTEDVVSFSSDRSNHVDISLFGDQPDFRYGRMKLSDVGGNIDTQISVPLATEYWEDDSFITNTDDIGSEFDADDYCRQTIWRDETGTTSARFSSSETEIVEEGEFDSLTATHGGESREQIRLWLRQQSIEPDGLNSSDCFSSGSITDQPWLRYNWRGVGDEDPSAVVVFGIYRGNDRIIFRGEARLTDN